MLGAGALGGDRPEEGRDAEVEVDADPEGRSGLAQGGLGPLAVVGDERGFARVGECRPEGDLPPLVDGVVVVVLERPSVDDRGRVVVDPARAASAAICAAGSSVRVSGVPATGSRRKRSRVEAVPAASVPTALTERPSVPRSC